MRRELRKKVERKEKEGEEKKETHRQKNELKMK